MNTITCEHCGRSFRSERWDARTCSGKCRVALHRKLRRAGVPPATSGASYGIAGRAPFDRFDRMQAMQQLERLTQLAKPSRGLPELLREAVDDLLAKHAVTPDVTPLAGEGEPPRAKAAPRPTWERPLAEDRPHVKGLPKVRIPKPPDYAAIAAAHGAMLTENAARRDLESWVLLAARSFHKAWEAKTPEQRLEWARAHAPPTPEQRERAQEAKAQRTADRQKTRAQSRRRRAELHPDKLGRDQTAAERAEYVKLTKRRRRR